VHDVFLKGQTSFELYEFVFGQWITVGVYLNSVWFAAAQASGSKPATSSATEVKTEQPAQTTESKPDTAGTVVKQDTAAAAGEPAKSADETTSASKDETEEKEKAVTVEDSDTEEKMDTETNEQNKAKEDEEEVSFMSKYSE